VLAQCRGRSQACVHGGRERPVGQYPFHAGEQPVELAAEPQGLGRLALHFARDVFVVDAGEDQVRDIDGLVGPLGTAQYRQASPTDLQPLRLFRTHGAEGERGQVSCVVGADVRQALRGGHENQGAGHVAGRRRVAGVRRGEQHVALRFEVVPGEPVMRCAHLLARHRRENRVAHEVVGCSQGVVSGLDQPGCARFGHGGVCTRACGCAV
jgi:hypothetical protein